jgi:DNA replication and repair protein RecF
MWLSQLRLVNFRNLRQLTLDLEPGLAVFVGQNAQGKTNLLEAVHVLATTRSPRTSSERELVTWRAPASEVDIADLVPPFARLTGRVQRRAGEVHLEVVFKGELPPLADNGTASSWGTAGEVTVPLTRDITVNGLPTRAAELIGHLPVVYFSPGDVVLAGGPPAARRQYLNVANSQIEPPYLRALQRYNRVLLQRNQVLRQVRERRQLATALEPWTEQLVQSGAFILRQRLAMLAAVNEHARTIFHDLSGTTDDLRIRYRSTVLEHQGNGSELPAAADIARCFTDRQQQLAAREVDQAVSLVGPHRDDFVFMLGGVDLNTYGSRGQQRLAVLALKLAEITWMHETIGELPVLLLDDLLSELDPRKRSYVLDRLARSSVASDADRSQVWVTTTDVAPFGDELLAAAQRFEIDAGRVRRA